MHAKDSYLIAGSNFVLTFILQFTDLLLAYTINYKRKTVHTYQERMILVPSQSGVTITVSHDNLNVPIQLLPCLATVQFLNLQALELFPSLWHRLLVFASVCVIFARVVNGQMRVLRFKFRFKFDKKKTLFVFLLVLYL